MAERLVRFLREFLLAVRQRKTDQILTLLFGLWAAALTYLWTKSLPGVLQTAQRPLTWLALAGAAITILWIALRIWRRAWPPEIPGGPALPSPIKGLLPFVQEDGELFLRLGRKTEVEELLSLILNEQIPLIVVRGESGAGKTSLLRAGLAYDLKKRNIPCVYWEARPDEPEQALLHAIRALAGAPAQVETLEHLPGRLEGTVVLILDQFEQLREEEARPQPIFKLLEEAARALPPHRLRVVIAFRREYDSAWLDFEQKAGIHCPRVSVRLFPPEAARDVMATLGEAASLTLENALLEGFLHSVKTAQGVSPVDMGIAMLSLSDWARQKNRTEVTAKDYELAGGAEGLLTSYVQERLAELPETERAPLLKALLFELVDLETDQRLAGGASLEQLVRATGIEEPRLRHRLEYLAISGVRILEKLDADAAREARYRLPHERLIPVLRRLNGVMLAEADQARLVFEEQYRRWRRTRSRRDLLRGRALSRVRKHGPQVLAGEDKAERAGFLQSSLAHRRLRMVGLAAALAVVVTGGVLTRDWVERGGYRAQLVAWKLPPDLYDRQFSLRSLTLGSGTVTSLAWLRSPSLRSLAIYGRSLGTLAGVGRLKGLRSLTLNLR